MLPIHSGTAFLFFFTSRRRHTRLQGDWSSDVCSSDLILAGRKRSRFTVALGAGTATGDTEGAVTTTAPVPPLERAALEALLRRFRGPQTQTPPMYSAVKRAGQPLYKLARAGVTVARAARAIELFELTLLVLGPATLELERSEEHTSELQSPCNLVCRLLLEKKKNIHRPRKLIHVPQPFTV